MSDGVLKAIVRLAWIVPGFFLWASFPPMGEKTDIVFALAPLLWISRKGDVVRSVKVWLANGLFFWVASLAWMPAIVKNGGPWPLVVLGWGALAAYCAAYFAAFGALSSVFWRWVDSGSESRPLRTSLLRLFGALAVEPILWCGLELVRCRFAGGFAWNLLGTVPANGGFGAPASLGGIYLLSAVVVLINGSLAGIIERFVMTIRRERFPRWRAVETFAALAVVYGIFKLATVFAPVETESRPLRAALVQRNFPCVFDRNRVENPNEVYSNLLSRVAHVRPQLVVMPESALAEYGPLTTPAVASFVRSVFRHSGADAMLAGGTRFSESSEYNSAALFVRNDRGISIDIYDKVHLVPFGEYIPGDKIFVALQKLAPVGSCTPGELKTLKLGDINLGVGICYEDTDSAQIRKLAEKGAEVLVFITNDSWFSRSIEPWQHAWQSVGRALETGLPVLRVGNSGVTGSVSAHGIANWLTDDEGRPLVDASGIMCDTVAVPKAGAPRTLYVRLGDKPLAIAFGLILVLMATILYRRRRDQFKDIEFVDITQGSEKSLEP